MSGSVHKYRWLKKRISMALKLRNIQAIFPCYGPSFKSMPELNEKIFKEWLPNSNEYEIAAGYNLEMYSDPTEYENGIMNEKYYTEVWIPVKKKELQITICRSV